MILGVLAALSIGGPPDDLYEVHREADRLTISANSGAVSCQRALTALGTQLGWVVRFEPEKLREDFENEIVDLSFTRQGPRTIARLIAIAGGGDIVFDESPDSAALRVVVVASPDPTSEVGRTRLRKRAIEWYRTWLDERVPSTGTLETSLETRMHMARLLREQGALMEAIAVYISVARDDPERRLYPSALLHIAEGLRELGGESLDEAEHWARELASLPATMPESASGAILLGRILISRGRHRHCIKVLTNAYGRVAGFAEILDLHLTIATAHMYLDEPQAVLDSLAMLAEAKPLDQLDDRRVLEYLLLDGFGRQGTGQPVAAIESLRLFLGGAAEGDPSRAAGWMILGEALLDNGQFVQAHLAAQRALGVGDAEPVWNRSARVLFARTSLAVGRADRVFDDLTGIAESVRDDDPQFVLFLVDALDRERRLQKAIEVADLLDTRDDVWGDRARTARIRAMWQRARQTDALAEFPKRALAYARRISDTASQREVARLFGSVYEELGQFDSALDAYRGVLR